MLSLGRNGNWIELTLRHWIIYILTDEMMPPTNEVNHYFIWIINFIYFSTRILIRGLCSLPLPLLPSLLLLLLFFFHSAAQAIMSYFECFKHANLHHIEVVITNANCYFNLKLCSFFYSALVFLPLLCVWTIKGPSDSKIKL